MEVQQIEFYTAFKFSVNTLNPQKKNIRYIDNDMTVTSDSGISAKNINWSSCC